MPVASQALADHGRNCHRLSDQWRLECKKAKDLGAKPPLPPQAKKRQEAAAAKKAAIEARGGNPPTAKGEEGERVETDSSEDERAVEAMDTADAPASEAPPPQEPADGPSRPSFLAV